MLSRGRLSAELCATSALSASVRPLCEQPIRPRRQSAAALALSPASQPPVDRPQGHSATKLKRPHLHAAKWPPSNNETLQWLTTSTGRQLALADN